MLAPLTGESVLISASHWVTSKAIAVLYLAEGCTWEKVDGNHPVYSSKTIFGLRLWELAAQLGPRETRQ